MKNEADNFHSGKNVKNLSDACFTMYEVLFATLSPKIQKSEEDRLQELTDVVKKGANINAQSTSDNNNTPLHIATLNGYKSVVTYLLGYPSIKTDIKKGKSLTALNLIEKRLKIKNLKNRKIYEDIKRILEDHCSPVQKTDQALRGEMANKYEDMVFYILETAGRTKLQNSKFKIGRGVTQEYHVAVPFPRLLILHCC